MTDTQKRQISNTILEQLGGRRFRVMTGAKQFTYGDTTTRFRIGRNAKRINLISITLDPSDTYTITFLWATTRTVITRATYTGVYADMLQSLFTRETGLLTSLR